jgi:catechol 2,3-dioxygenase-like lactoylglutathione lyase family enzyme
MAERLRPDHLAFPSFDAGETYRFYTEVLGFRLKFAWAGESEEWGGSYLMTGYDFGGGEIHFFDLDGARRPKPDSLPKDIRHVALTVGTRREVAAWRRRLGARGVSFWTEEHGSDLSVYFTDPNGIVLELTSHRREPFRLGAARHGVDVVRQWTAARRQRSPQD